MNPLSLSYIRIVRLFLRSLFLWPCDALGEKEPLLVSVLRYTVPLHGTFAVFGGVIFLVKFGKTVTFFVIGHCFITEFLGVLTIVRASLPCFKQFGKLVRDFLFSFHLMHYKYKGGYYVKTHDFIDRVSTYFAQFSALMMVVGMILFNLSPLYNNYKIGAYTGSRIDNSTIELAVYYYYPFFDPMERYKLATLLNFYFSYLCSVVVCMIDLLVLLMVFQIIGHIQILIHSLEHFPQPKSTYSIEGKHNTTDVTTENNEMYDYEEKQIVHKLLTECIDHHKLIVKFTKNLSSFFGPMLAINYIYHLFSCCLLLLECSRGDMDAIVGFGPLTIIIFGQLIEISITFEVVDTVSQKLADAVYKTPWECMDTKNRRTVCFFLSRVQTPIRVTAMGMTTVGVTTMVGILKTTLSYFAMLRSMGQ